MRRIMNRLLARLDEILPPAASAHMRYFLRSTFYFNPLGTAMNGQTSRLEAARQILFRCNIRQIVETGAYRGTTTEWFAGFDLPVNAIEIDEQSYRFSKLRLASHKNVRVAFGNSIDHLQSLVAQLNLTVPTFFYLDAHWNGQFPLMEEMNIITDHFSCPVILIDDFQIADDPEYGYDDYGSGKALTFKLLKACWREGMQVFYPSTPAQEETGSRRGWVVVTTDPGLADNLSKFDLLRRVPQT